MLQTHPHRTGPSRARQHCLVDRYPPGAPSSRRLDSTVNLSPAFIEGVGGPEIMVIMFVFLLFFGADKLPALAKGIGKTVREFKKAASGVEEEVRRAMEETEEVQPKKFPPHPPPPVAIQQGTPESPKSAPPHSAD